MRSLASVAVLGVLLQSNIADAVFTPNIDFSRQDEWVGLCSTGMRQSPINIDRRKVVVNQSLPDLVLENIDKEQFVIVTNQNYTAEFNFSGRSLPTLSGGGLKGNYTLQNLYFVFPSGHTVNGRHYRLEGLFVFVSNKYDNIEQSYIGDDGVAYLSVFYELSGNKKRKSIDQLAEATSTISKEVYSQAEIKNFVIPISNLNLETFYTYEGSIQTPPCYETVTYFIAGDPVTITHDEYEKLTNLYQSSKRRLSNNNRRLQPLNEREVYLKSQ